MRLSNDEAIVEAILFASGEPVALKRISEIIKQSEKVTEVLISNLKSRYEAENRGFQIAQIEKSYQMSTNPKYFEYVEMLLKTPQKKQLTQTLIETLAIIAYKQPITKNQIQEIRGVNSEHQVNKLIEANLVTEMGRSDAPGKPILFGTSIEFLKYFGFSSLDALPELDIDLEKLRKEAESELSEKINLE